MNFEELEALNVELISKYNSLPKIGCVFDREDLIKKIESIIYSLLESMTSGDAPKFETLKFGDDSVRTRIIDFHKINSRSKFASVVFLLSKAHSLLISGQTSTRRELYYENTTIFHSQNQVDVIMKDISYILNAPSWELGILATSKGLVAGALSITMADGSVIVCNRSGGVLIPQNVLGITKVTSKAKWILIVEKDAAFQKLLDSDGLTRLGPVIFITAKGYPDINTRLLLRKLWEELHLPTLCLVDADPHGIEIMCVYRFGSMAMSPFSDCLVCPFVRWLGVHPSDIKSLANNSQALTPRDIKKIDNLLARSYVKGDLSLKNQLEILRRENVKAEIEGLSQISGAYITDIYLPSKIRGNEYY